MDKMDGSMKKAIAEFIATRVGEHGLNEDPAVSDAFIDFGTKVGRLRKGFTENQVLLLNDCEKAFRMMHRETTQFYYRVGFGDALTFLLNWQEQSKRELPDGGGSFTEK